MEKNAELLIPLDAGESLTLNCSVNYEDLVLGKSIELELLVHDMNYCKFQDFFFLTYLAESEDEPIEQVKKYCNLNVEGELYILCGCIFTDVLRDKLKMTCDKVILNEV
jgi:hypothetical protein